MIPQPLKGKLRNIKSIDNNVLLIDYYHFKESDVIAAVRFLELRLTYIRGSEKVYDFVSEMVKEAFEDVINK